MRIATPWIYSPKFDLAAIIGPPAVITAIVLIWGERISQIGDTPPWLWILLVLGIDVAHVYSSLFRTYFDRDEFRKRRTLYVAVPVISWVTGVSLWVLGGQDVFWLVVAYFAIYHFVRQQYGFLMLYRRGEPRGAGYRIDQAAIYLATLYPLIYWHTYGRNFLWFDQAEILRIPSVVPEILTRVIYIAVLLAFLAKEAWRWQATWELNLGKCLLLFATAAAWGTGIILFNGDLTFTLINIVSHGIPYMALIWIYQYRKRSNAIHSENRLLKFFQLKFVPLYICGLVAIAWIEEGIWDRFVYKEHADIFGTSGVAMPAAALAILVPLLTMPQVTHYVLDAFIWRVNKKGKEEVRAVIG